MILEFPKQPLIVAPSYEEVWRKMMELAQEKDRLQAQNEILERKLAEIPPTRRWWQVWR